MKSEFPDLAENVSSVVSAVPSECRTMVVDPKLVSVITIFLNAEAFLEEAIGSVFAQSHSHWELLLVDDGSTDSSAEIAQRWSREHPDRVRYLRHPDGGNHGMSASRNLGLAEARGGYIALLDADDVWLPNKLREQLAILDAQPQAFMVYGRSELWYSWSGDDREQGRDHMLPLGVEPDTIVQPPVLLLLLLENKVQTPTTCNVLLRRQVFDRVGGFQDAFRGMFEDQVFFSKIGLHLPVYVSNACWARYRQHRDSCCARASARGSEEGDRLRFLYWLQSYFDECRITDTRLLKALQAQLWSLEHPTHALILKRARQLWRRLRRRIVWFLGSAGISRGYLLSH